MRSLGTDDVVDYTQKDVVDRDERYDIVVDTAGSQPLLTDRRPMVVT